MVETLGFGKRLTECMEKAGYNNKELTKELGLSKNAIGNYKNNQIPNAAILYEISQKLGTTMEYLLTGKDKDNLSIEEKQLVIAYRKADLAIQTATKKLLDVNKGEDMERLSSSKTG